MQQIAPSTQRLDHSVGIFSAERSVIGKACDKTVAEMDDVSLDV
jgi:hypothetical protein